MSKLEYQVVRIPVTDAETLMVLQFKDRVAFGYARDINKVLKQRSLIRETSVDAKTQVVNVYVAKEVAIHYQESVIESINLLIKAHNEAISRVEKV
jgi:hypothetical protein